MEKTAQYLSGSFDGLSGYGGGPDLQQYFKSSFAKSMALETTKSLNFDLNLTGGGDDRDAYHRHRYNTIGSQRQVSEKIVGEKMYYFFFFFLKIPFQFCSAGE